MDAVNSINDFIQVEVQPTADKEEKKSEISKEKKICSKSTLERLKEKVLIFDNSLIKGYFSGINFFSYSWMVMAIVMKKRMIQKNIRRFSNTQHSPSATYPIIVYNYCFSSIICRRILGLFFGLYSELYLFFLSFGAL